MNAVSKQQTPKAPGQSHASLLADDLYGLDALAGRSPNVVAEHSKASPWDGDIRSIPRYVFIGPKGGGEPIRIGLFAGIHGDEPEGAFALIEFLRCLDAGPELAKGYCLFVYPVCNPTGIGANSRQSSTGKDLNREFWSGSAEPEVRFLEAELTRSAFHGIISLHTDDTSNGFYGYAHGPTLTEHLIEPALKAAETFLPRNRDSTIDGFSARNGVIRDGFRGILSAPPNVRPRPFEIILETPKAAAQRKKVAAFVAALQSILENYRELVAYAPNL